MAKEATAEQIAHAVVNVIDDEFIRVTWSRLALVAAGIFTAGAVTGVKLNKRYQKWRFERKYGPIEM